MEEGGEQKDVVRGMIRDELTNLKDELMASLRKEMLTMVQAEHKRAESATPRSGSTSGTDSPSASPTLSSSPSNTTAIPGSPHTIFPSTPPASRLALPSEDLPLDLIAKTLEINIAKVRADLRELINNLPLFEPQKGRRQSTKKPTEFKEEDMATLYVGGGRYQTLLTTLRRYPNSLLGRMAISEKHLLTTHNNTNTNNNHNNDKEGGPFFDRNREAFEHILEYYRTGVLCKPPSIAPRIWEQELEYWGIPNPEHNKDTTNDHNNHNTTKEEVSSSSGSGKKPLIKKRKGSRRVKKSTEGPEGHASTPPPVMHVSDGAAELDLDDFHDHDSPASGKKHSKEKTTSSPAILMPISKKKERDLVLGRSSDSKRQLGKRLSVQQIFAEQQRAGGGGKSASLTGTEKFNKW